MTNGRQEFWRRAEAPFVLERLRGQGGRLLDVGCGTGWYLGELAGIFSECVGIDPSAGMLEIARRRVPAATLLQSDLNSLVVGTEASMRS